MNEGPDTGKPRISVICWWNQQQSKGLTLIMGGVRLILHAACAIKSENLLVFVQVTW